MKRKLLYITVDMNVMTQVSKLVPPYDVPMYRAAVGDEKVQITGAHEVEVDALPDAAEERMRLRNQFGVDPATKQSLVDVVYGTGADGLKKLEEAIKDTGSKADPELAQKVVDGKGKVDKETAEKREKAYRDPRTGDPIEDIDKAPIAKDRAATDTPTTHTVTISSTAPIRTGPVPKPDPLAGGVTRTSTMAASQAGFASSEAVAAARTAEAAARAAEGAARFANQEAGLVDGDGNPIAKKATAPKRTLAERKAAKRAANAKK